MFRKKTWICLVLLIAILSACGQTPVQTQKPESTPPAAQTPKENETQAPKTKLTMFMSNMGAPHRDGVNPSDNPYINIVEDYANVDLEIEVPPWPDFKTKLDLLYASANLPDIVANGYPDESIIVGDNGGFIDLKTYYDQSEIVQKYVTSTMMEIIKSKSGKYYRIPTPNVGLVGTGVLARWDIVSEYNDNKWPASIDEWIDLMRKIHEAQPEWTVMSNRVIGDYGLAYAGTPIFVLYGAAPFGWRYDYDTKSVISNFILPEYKAAIKAMKTLYDEGILDKEFATKDTTAYDTDLSYNNVLLNTNSYGSMSAYTQAMQNRQRDQAMLDRWEWAAVPPLTTNPPEVKDSIYTQPFDGIPAGSQGMYVSAKCKNPDIAWKVIEGFAADDLFEAIFWGSEGRDYTVVNGSRVIDETKIFDDTRSWAVHLALLFGTDNAPDVKNQFGEQVLGKEVTERIKQSINPTQIMAKEKGPSPLSFVSLSNDTVTKLAEMRQFQSTATIEAIMGKITMEQFDQKVDEYKQKFGFIDEEYTNLINEDTERLLSYGVKLSR